LRRRIARTAAEFSLEQIDDASHWIPLDAPDRLNQFLLEWLD